jgi:hypothetical protein
MSTTDDAKKLIAAFERRTTGNLWINMKRLDLARGLSQRVDDPDLINQGQTSLCGPADFVRDIAIDDPVMYVKAATDLFETGSAVIGTFFIKPTRDLRIYKVPATAKIDPADWILCASIRDMDNWFFDYQSETDDAAAITMPHSKAKWLKQAGYSHVVNETNVVFTKDLPNARAAGALLGKGYKVALFVNANMLDASTQDDSSAFPDHWIALTKELRIEGMSLDPTSKVSFRVYTWGKQRNVPEYGTLSIKSFLANYYGYVACKH